MSLCQSVDTLAMAYLDDELVGEERRELELHAVECAPCREHIDRERAELAFVRAALVAPPASDLLKRKLALLLDTEDRAATRANRWRPVQWVGRYVLPGAATLAAVAAILAFSFVKPREPAPVAVVANEVVRQQTRALPLEVQGANTGPWLKEHFAAVELPTFQAPGIELMGARLTSVAGHEAALLTYLVTDDRSRFKLTAVVVEGLKGTELTGGTPIKVGDRMLYVHDADGHPAVTYVDEMGMTYAFTSDRLGPQELLELVVSSDLIGRAQQAR